MKEQYIKMRNSGKVDINWMYSYYKSYNGVLDYPNFFAMMHRFNIQEILSNLDKEYGLTLLIDKENNLIKAFA